VTIRPFDYKNGGFESLSGGDYEGKAFITGNYIKSSGVMPPVTTPVHNVKPKFLKPIIIDGHTVKGNEEISMNVFFEGKKAEPVDFNKAEDAAFNIAKQISGTKIKVEIKAYVLIEVNATLDNLVPETNITYRKLVKKRADYMVHRLIQNGVKPSQIITVIPGKSQHKGHKITATFKP